MNRSISSCSYVDRTLQCIALNGYSKLRMISTTCQFYIWFTQPHEPLHLSNGMFGWAFWWECIQRATQPNLNSDSVSNVFQCSMSIATALPIIRLAKRVFSLNSLQPLAFRRFSEFLKNIFKLYNWKCFVIFDSHQPTKLTGLAVRMRKWDREWMKWKDECYNNDHRKTIETIQKHSTF